MFKTSKKPTLTTTSKPVDTKSSTSNSLLKNEKQKSTTKKSVVTDKNTTKKSVAEKKSNNVNAGLSVKNVNSKALIKTKSLSSSKLTTPNNDKALAANKKNVMNTIHNVTVASPPSSAKGRSTSLVNVRENAEFADEKLLNHSRSRTRTIAPEESLLYQRKITSVSKHPIEIIRKDPVAYEINFDEAKKERKAVEKQKSQDATVSNKTSNLDYDDTDKNKSKLVRQKSMLKEGKAVKKANEKQTILRNEKQSSNNSSLDNVDTDKNQNKLTRQKSMIKEAIKPKEVQKSSKNETESEQKINSDSVQYDKNKSKLLRQTTMVRGSANVFEMQKSSQEETESEKNSFDSISNDKLEKKKSMKKEEEVIEHTNEKEESQDDEQQQEEEEDCNYESDFESYESDFEAEPSADESSSEKSTDSEDQTVQKRDKDRIDSGSFDLSIKKSATSSSAQYDSIDADTVNSHDSGISYDDLNALNKRLLSPKVYDLHKRGEELMKKITFDSMTFDIYEQKPIQYEVFMSIYGQRGMTQASTQCESTAVCEEVQTEEISRINAWTQFPAKFTRYGLEMINSKQYNEEKLGVGEEIMDSKTSRDDQSIDAINNFSNNDDFTVTNASKFYNAADLNRFVQNAAMTMTNLIEGKSSVNVNRELQPTKIPISRGCLQLKFNEIEVLRNTIVSKIYTNLCLNNFLITIHKTNASCQNLMCLWNILHTSRPLRIFSAWNDIKCLEIHPEQSDFIVGGCNDGTICLWDIQEFSEWKENNEDVIKPCEIISLNQFQNDFSLDNVTALKSLPHRHFKSTSSMFSQSQASQLCSLHENGVLSIWTLLQIEDDEHKNEIKKSELDFVYNGSKVKLIKNLTIDLNKFTRTVEEKPARRKSAFEKTRYYFENDLFNDKVLQELQEIDNERLQRSKKISLREDIFTAISFDVNLNELFIASDSNFVIALSRLCLGDKARKIITNETSFVSPSLIKIHPIDKSVMAVGQTNGSVKFIKISNENPSNVSKQRKQLKRSNATTSDDVLAKSCAFQNIVEREKKLYSETQALNNLESDELKAFLINEALSKQFVEDENMRNKLKVSFDKNIFNSFDVCMGGGVKQIEFNRSGQLTFILTNKEMKIFNCWSNVEIENNDQQKIIDVKCVQGSDGSEFLILLTKNNEILVNKLKY